MSIKGKVALITGGGDGIGKTVALHFAQLGAKLFVCDINPDSLEKVKVEIEARGAECGTAVYDARKPADCKNAFDALISKYGDIDILINNTGIPGPTKSVTEVTLEEWDEQMEVNLRSTFYFIQLAAPYMMAKRSGKIVNMSSITGKRTLYWRAPYCTSKIGIIGLTRCVAEELGEYNINVNAVCPGLVESPRRELLISREMARTGQTYDEVAAKQLTASFIKRPVQTIDIAKLIAFLCDDELSSAITAQDYNVNCGSTSG